MSRALVSSPLVSSPLAGRRLISTATPAAVALALVLALSGCGRGGQAAEGSPTPAGPSAAQSSSAPAGTAKAAPSQVVKARGGIDQRSAGQIEGAVNDAQTTLDGLEQDFAGDDAASG